MQSPLFATEAGNKVIENTGRYQQAVHSRMLSVAQGEIMLLLLSFALC
jgi:hypothetical protein